MILKRIVLPVLFICSLSASSFCQKSSSSGNVKSFKINGVSVTTKASFEFDTLGIVSPDTLRLTSCGEYVYSPFGKLYDKKDLKKSVLKDFQVADKKHWAAGEEFLLNELTLDSNKLILFFDKNPDEVPGSYVLKGEIFDNRIIFQDGIKIGMNTDDFYKTFFSLFPVELENRYRVVSISTCENSVIHYYNFKDGKLLKVMFDCDERYWKLEY